MLQNLTIDAFAHSTKVLAALGAFAQHRQVQRCKVSVRPGGVDTAIAHYAGTVTPTVIIVEDDVVEHMDGLAEVCDPGTKVVVIGSVNDVRHYRALMAKGVAEYLLSSPPHDTLSDDLIFETLDRLFADPKAAPKGKVVSFWGARGGAGSSCLAQNVAWLLGEHLQENVLYIDCDLSFGSSQVALGLDARQTFADVIAHTERLDQVFVERSLNTHGTYLRVLASPSDLRPRGIVTVDAMDRLLDIVQRMAPVVVLDLPHVWTDWTEQLMRLSSERVVTAWPDFSSIKNVKALIEGLDMPMKLVLNGVDAYKRTQLSAKDFEDTLSVKPELSIPFEPNVFGDAANKGQIAAQTNPNHRVTKLMTGLAVSLCGKPARPQPRKGGLAVLDWLRA